MHLELDLDHLEIISYVDDLIFGWGSNIYYVDNLIFSSHLVHSSYLQQSLNKLDFSILETT